MEIFALDLKSNKTYLKGLDCVILNLFQDLMLGKKPDAESILSQAQHKVQKHDNICF